MEFINQEHKNELTILNIESSASYLFAGATDNAETNLNFSPVFFIDTRKKIFAVRMDIQFLTLSETASVMVFYQAQKFDSVFSIEKEKIEAKDLDVIIRMLDTTIGIMRGILYEQTKETPFEGIVLPFIELDELLAKMKVKVIGQVQNGN